MMEGDGTSASPPPVPDLPSPTVMLIQRLCRVGVPMTYLDSMEMGLIQFVGENKGLLRDIVRVLMPSVEEMQIQGSIEGKAAWHEFKQGCKEGVRWAQWLMFGGNPEEVMKGIQEETGHVRGVCGAVWGSDDIAYRCRTCENDPTCAICVSCFESAKHINHDYSMIHTGGGCCDCGDMTAWKESGFCSRHSGTAQAPRLSEALVSTFEPVMEALLLEWGNRLRAAAKFSSEVSTKMSDGVKKVAIKSSLTLIEMLLSFCSCSESLLTCSGSLIASENIGLLDLLLKSECFLPEKALYKLHELLFKLMGNPSFKCQFARTFIRHYPHFIQDGLRQSLETPNGRRARESVALSSFPVQIFTVPTLTPLLVVDLKLLDMLLEALKDAFLSCSGGDAQQLVSKGYATSDFFTRIIDDIRFVLRHAEVADYVARERLDLLIAWLHLLAFTQGMDSQRRQTSIHVEEETENWLTAHFLEVQMASIHPLLTEGAAKMDSSVPANRSLSHGWIGDEDATHGHAKIGRTSAGSDVSGKVGTCNSVVPMDVDGGMTGVVSQGDVGLATASSRAPGVPAVLLWLVAECSKVLGIWFLLDEYRESSKSSRANGQKGGFIQRGLQLRGRGGRATGRSFGAFAVDNTEGEVPDTEATREAAFREWLRSSRHIELMGAQNNADRVSSMHENLEVGDVSSHVRMQEGKDGQDNSAKWWMGVTLPGSDINAEFLRSEREWLEIDFDVSLQEVSFHIPLHRFLAVALQKSLEANPNLNHKEGNKRSWHCQDHLVSEKGLLLQLFPTCYQAPAFISCLMEHPLRIQVLCAQVRAGMWRKNGHSVQALFENYHSVKWCEGSLDLDLFLLQCCGVMAPTEEFVSRIVSRFGLNEYFSLFLLLPNEYETTLAQQMLVLLIQIVVERGFCGLTASQACRRELIKRLAVSDATHSQLMKSLPPRLHEDKQWQEALLAVATYYKPSGMQQGRFSLRQECWKELDLYHPRWNARELQSAEDRFYRACKVSSVVKLPQWQKPFVPFENLSRLATCKKVHDILRSIFFHAVFSEKISESRAPENVLITALHLLALGLDVCSLFAYRKGLESKFSSFQSESGSSDAQEPPPLLANATERVYFGGADRIEISNRQSLVSLLVLLMRRYGGDSEAHGTTGESTLSSIGALIKILLEKFSSLHSGCMYEIESLAPEILHRVSPPHDVKLELSNTTKQPGLSETDRKKSLARERQAAIMAKMKAAQEKFVASCQSSQEQDKERSQSKTPGGCFQFQREQSSQIPSAVMCALCRDSTSNCPISFLTFVQRSKLLEIAAKGVPSWQKRVWSKRVETLIFNEGADNNPSVVDSEVHESQIRVELLNLIQMALNGEVAREEPLEVEALLAFLGDDGFTESVEGSQSSVEARMAETTSSDSGSDDSGEEESTIVSNDSPNDFLDCSGLALAKYGVAPEYEDEKAKIRQNSLITVLLEYANILSKNRKYEQQLESENSASSQKQNSSRLLQRNAADELSHDNIGSNDLVGTHMSSCGHAVHQECLDRYLSSLLQRYQSRTLFEGLQIVDPNQGEFLCPVCRRLANSVLPYIVEATGPGITGEEQVANSLLSPYKSSSSLVSLVPSAMNLLWNAEELVGKPGFRKAVSKPVSRTLSSTFDSLFWTLFGLQFPGRENNSRHSSSRISQSLLLWDVFRYTVMSAELASRTQKDSLTECPVDVLLKAADEGSMLSVLLRAAKAIQNQNRRSLLLRARGMQLLVGSICFGVSKDSLAEPFMPGSVSKLLHLIDNGKEAADIHFWRRTADPVLVHDPFSSLLWIVFCFPLSFPPSIEPYISLVHLLYLVCILQIMAALGNSILSNLSELQLTPPACTFIQTMVTNLTGIRIFEPLNDQTSQVLSGPILLTIRRFTLPYLRCCALLGKLLCVVNFEETDFETTKAYNFVTAEEGVDWTNKENKVASSDFLKDLNELKYLEGRFLLPSLQSILESEANQEIALRWCNHLCKDAGPRKFLPLPRPTLAVPFKLMDLPPLYQTLLQSCIRERCPGCSSVPEQPALCLLCGTLCCGPGRRACCSINRQSECFRHAVACNGGVGVFLMIKKTNILLQRSARQAYWPSPYLDTFGEEDIDMHRGKPLYLNEERYAALTKMVVSHGLDHSSLVLSHTTWETVIWG